MEHLGLSRRGYPVSILVLLDVSLKASPSVCVYHKQYGFNPCSFGCQSERCRRAAGGHRDCQVSILVLLDVSLKAPILRDRHGERQVSILVLLDVSLKAPPPVRRNLHGRVSILVLLDVSLKVGCSITTRR